MIKRIISCLLSIFFCTSVYAEDLIVTTPCRAKIAGKTYTCALGKNGVTHKKVEGDLKTPLGTFPLRLVMYRPDRIKGLATGLPIHVLGRNDGWCDNPDSPWYNQFFYVNDKKDHELLWRDDYLYDLMVVIGYNDQPIIRGLGSAIFIHVARPNFRPTMGCVAFQRHDLMEILRHLDKDSKIVIRES